MKTLLLDIRDVEACLSMEGVIAAVEEGYRAFSAGLVQQPDIVSVDIPQHHGETDVKTCYNPANGYTSVKIASGFYDNQRLLGLPNAMGTITLVDGKAGAAAISGSSDKEAHPWSSTSSTHSPPNAFRATRPGSPCWRRAGISPRTL